MQLVRQLLSFGSVGMVATVVHVALAYVLMLQTATSPFLANLAGFLAAFGISFFGNAKLTFGYDGSLTGPMVRFLAISFVSLTLTSGITALVEAQGLPRWTYVVLTLATVPPITFLLAKFWVFAVRD